jgi:hypothetical protein
VRPSPRRPASATRCAELPEEAAVVGAHPFLDQSPVIVEPEDVDQVHDDPGAGRGKRAGRRLGELAHERALDPRLALIDENDRLRGLARASYAPAERLLAAAIADDLHVQPDELAPRLAATTAVTGLRELYDSRDARSLGPEPTGADLIQLVNQVIDYAIAGLAR